jgi:hypothetical protein
MTVSTRDTPVPDRPDGTGRGRRLVLWLRSRMSGDEGMNTAEYAVGTIAAVAFAGILLKVLTSGTVEAALSAIIQRALG